LKFNGGFNIIGLFRKWVMGNKTWFFQLDATTDLIFGVLSIFIVENIGSSSDSVLGKTERIGDQEVFAFNVLENGSLSDECHFVDVEEQHLSASGSFKLLVNYWEEVQILSIIKDFLESQMNPCILRLLGVI